MKIKCSDWSLVKQNGRKGDRRRGCRGIGKKAAFLECSLETLKKAPSIGHAGFFCAGPCNKCECCNFSNLLVAGEMVAAKRLPTVNT